MVYVLWSLPVMMLLLHVISAPTTHSSSAAAAVLRLLLRVWLVLGAGYLMHLLLQHLEARVGRPILGGAHTLAVAVFVAVLLAHDPHTRSDMTLLQDVLLHKKRRGRASSSSSSSSSSDSEGEGGEATTANHTTDLPYDWMRNM